MQKITYKKSGVDIDAADGFIRAIKPLAKGIGGFGGLFRLDTKNYKEPYLVASTDGVGTKLKLAFLTGRHDTVGIDLVAMNVNDILCMGAKPLFFLDYIATGKLSKNVLVDVVKGIAEGCRQAGCRLLGGETAQMPGFYNRGEYDLAGFCVGILDKSRAVTGANVKAGDVLVGIESSGPHSNGYSLIRKVFSRRELKQHAKELLAPTRIYVKPVLNLIRNPQSAIRNAIKAIAHVTGGAFYEKVPRVIPRGLGIRVHTDTWICPDIFKRIQRRGNVPVNDMYRTFNMGIGMVLVTDAAFAAEIKSHLAGHGLRSWVIGEVTKGKKRVELVG